MPVNTTSWDHIVADQGELRSGYSTPSTTSLAVVRPTLYTEPGTAVARSMRSDHADDNNTGGDGAKIVRITYFDGDMDGPHTVDVALQGTTWVDVDPVPSMRFIEKMEIWEVGANASNHGNIILNTTTGGGGSEIGRIAAGDGTTFWAHHYVAKNHVAYLKSVYGGVGGDPVLLNFRCINPLLADQFDRPIGPEFRAVPEVSGNHWELPIPIRVEGPARLTMWARPESVASGNVVVRGGFGLYELTTEEDSPVSVVPLSTQPNPPNTDPFRAMFVWIANSPQPLDTDAEQQSLINFCGSKGVNTLFLDMYSYLGGSNWTSENVSRMQQFLDAAHRSGIKIFALAGNVDWGQNHNWVLENVVEPLTRFNMLADSITKRFDGLIYDVEYWTDETSYPPSDHLPGLCDLVKATKKRAGPGFQVGCFAAFYLKDNTSTRADITYNGKAAQDGEHLMDCCDFVAVSCYYETAQGQIDRYQPWYDYAITIEELHGPTGLYAAVETIDTASPETNSYWEEGEAAMESANTTVSNTFTSTTDPVWMGHAVHDYEHYSTMPA